MEQDASSLLDYSMLSKPEKVKAILAIVYEPVMKSQLLELAGIEYSKLSESEKAEVDEVFSQEDVDVTHSDTTQLFMLDDQGRQKLGQVVDMKSVHKALALNSMLISGYNF